MLFTDLERRYLADNASRARPRFASNVSPRSVSNCSLAALNKVAADAGIDVGDLTVTSSIRTAADQARIMYGQLEANNISNYLNPGQQVIAVYHAGKDRGDNEADIQSAMVAKIQQLQDKNELVSNHLGDPSKLNVFDIAPSSIPAGKTQAFQKALTDAVASNGISKFFSPYTSVHDPAFHLEINQPMSTNSDGEIDQRRVLRLMESLRQNEDSD